MDVRTKKIQFQIRFFNTINSFYSFKRPREGDRTVYLTNDTCHVAKPIFLIADNVIEFYLKKKKWAKQISMILLIFRLAFGNETLVLSLQQQANFL